MKTLNYILSIGLAAATGLAVGVLTAPRKGKHTRKRIMDELDNAKDSFEYAANQKLDEAKSIVNKSIEEQKKNALATAKGLVRR